MKKKARILIFDLETSPNVGYFWNPGYKISIGHENIVEERQIICVAYKWAGEKKVHSIAWNPKGKTAKDKMLLKKFSKVYNQADMVVAHNGDNFDIKWLNARMLYHRLPPLAPVKQCDTLKEVRRMFRLNSNRLDYVCKYLGYEGKKSMSFGDWIKVMQGDEKALKHMEKYCRQDVTELEQVFNDTRPYIKDGNIHQALAGDRDVCPSCGSSSYQKYGTYLAKTGRYQKYKCTSCCHVWKDTRMLKCQK
jgi:DNA polymerase elongation subunit (family B)